MVTMHKLLEEQRPLAHTLIRKFEIPQSYIQGLMELLQECVIEANHSKLAQEHELARTDMHADRWSASKSELNELIKRIHDFQKALSVLDNPGVQKRLKLSSYKLTNDIEPGSSTPLNASDRLEKISQQLQALEPIFSDAAAINGNEVKNSISHRDIANSLIHLCNRFWSDTLERPIKIDKSKTLAAGADVNELNPYLQFVGIVFDHCKINVAPNSLAQWTNYIRQENRSGM